MNFSGSALVPLRNGVGDLKPVSLVQFGDDTSELGINYISNG